MKIVYWKKLYISITFFFLLLAGWVLFAQFPEKEVDLPYVEPADEPNKIPVCKYYGYWDHLIAPEKLSGHVNMGKSFNAHNAREILDQNLSAVVSISHTLQREESVDQWRAKLTSHARAIQQYDPKDVAFVLLYDEPFRLGFTTEETELMVDLAKEIIGEQYKYGFTFTRVHTQFRDTKLPQNVDIVGINFYPFFEPDYTSNTVQTKDEFMSAFNTMMNLAREKAPAEAQFFITGQAFQQPGKWAKPPLDSPLWYGEIIQNTEDITGLIWFEWRDRGRWKGTRSFPDLLEKHKQAFQLVCPQ